MSSRCDRCTSDAHCWRAISTGGIACGSAAREAEVAEWNSRPKCPTQFRQLLSVTKTSVFGFRAAVIVGETAGPSLSLDPFGRGDALKSAESVSRVGAHGLEG